MKYLTPREPGGPISSEILAGVVVATIDTPSTATIEVFLPGRLNISGTVYSAPRPGTPKHVPDPKDSAVTVVVRAVDNMWSEGLIVSAAATDTHCVRFVTSQLLLHHLGTLQVFAKTIAAALEAWCGHRVHLDLVVPAGMVKVGTIASSHPSDSIE